ncbi:M20/M25/M40 family metallo-hydrolase, partial [Clostridioides difficile]
MVYIFSESRNLALQVGINRAVISIPAHVMFAITMGYIDKKPIIFSGHMDTVFETGTFGENPFKIIEGKAYGPGVLDMK